MLQPHEHRIPILEVISHTQSGLFKLLGHEEHLTPGITRRPARLTEHDKVRVGGRVQALVRRAASPYR